MTKDTPSNLEIPEQMREFAEQSVIQAKKAMDEFMTKTTSTIADMEGCSDALQKGASEVNRQAMSFAEENIRSALDLAERMVKTNDVQSLMKLQQDYLADRMASFGDQVKSMGDMAAKSADKAMKSK